MRYFQNIIFLSLLLIDECKKIPVVINTWGFQEANFQAWRILHINNGSALDAVETGCSTCETLQCDGTVGYGGSPDENGETTLDAMIMNGADMNIGAVGALRRVKSAISVSRHVLDYTKHTLLVGDQATKFAVEMGFNEESLSTGTSNTMWKKWKKNNCQPNFWTNVLPDPDSHCGPYKPKTSNTIRKDYEKYTAVFTKYRQSYGRDNHDTIGMIAIDANGNIVAGTSTNGARNKIPGRVGDSPIPGAGAYADNDVGGAAATGDGDIMMRFLPSFIAVEEMRRGILPEQAAITAINRIVNKHPNFFGGVIAVNKMGVYGASCRGMDEFPFSVVNIELGNVTVVKVSCIKSKM